MVAKRSNLTYNEVDIGDIIYYECNIHGKKYGIVCEKYKANTNIPRPEIVDRVDYYHNFYYDVIYCKYWSKKISNLYDDYNNIGKTPSHMPIASIFIHEKANPPEMKLLDDPEYEGMFI